MFFENGVTIKKQGHEHNFCFLSDYLVERKKYQKL